MKQKVENRVEVMGYLRENNLEAVSDPVKGRSIRGSITVAFDALNSIRIDVYAMESSPNKGTSNKAYESLMTLLPRSTTTIKDGLEGNPTATFDTLKDVVTKIVAHCEFREYAVKDEKGVESSRTKIQLLNWFESIHTPKPGKAFEIGAQFTVDAYIESIRPEFKAANPGEQPEETGRYIVSGLTPDYSGTMHRIEYVTEAGSVSEFIAEHWSVGGTTYLTGKVSNLMKTEQKEGVQGGFGMKPMSSTVTTFIEERLILGGGNTTIDANEEGYTNAGFTSEDVKNGLVKRAEIVAKNTESRAAKSNSAPQAQAQPQAAKNFGFDPNPAPKATGAAAQGGFGGFNPDAF